MPVTIMPHADINELPTATAQPVYVPVIRDGATATALVTSRVRYLPASNG